MDAFRAEDDFLLCGVNVLDARGSGDVSPAGFLFVRYKDGEGDDGGFSFGDPVADQRQLPVQDVQIGFLRLDPSVGQPGFFTDHILVPAQGLVGGKLCRPVMQAHLRVLCGYGMGEVDDIRVDAARIVFFFLHSFCHG